jgi:hypothetical protein
MKDIHMVQRNLKSLERPFPTFDPVNVPSNPNELFQEWFRIAIKKRIKKFIPYYESILEFLLEGRHHYVSIRLCEVCT